MGEVVFLVIAVVVVGGILALDHVTTKHRAKEENALRWELHNILSPNNEKPKLRLVENVPEDTGEEGEVKLLVPKGNGEIHKLESRYTVGHFTAWAICGCEVAINQGHGYEVSEGVAEDVSCLRCLKLMGVRRGK